MKDKTELAVYYERVSTHHVEQDESMENQRALANSYLKRHPEIQLAETLDTYSERVSGKSDARPKYKEMMKRLECGDVRYVLIKDFKRLNRSTELSSQIKNHSKEYNYKFILLSTGQVFDPNESQNRMMYGFESLVNEEVVFRQSEYARLSHRQKLEAKILNRNNIPFGYKWNFDKKDIVINDEQAEVIKKIYELYVFHDYGVLEIRRYLASIGIYYSGNTVSKFLQDSSYIGVFHLNKKGSELGVGAGQRTKRYNNPKEEWVAVERPDLAFLDKNVIDLAQLIRSKRRQQYDSEVKESTNKQSRFKGTHLFSAKVFCAECGYPFVFSYANRNQTVGIYSDTFSKRNREALAKCVNENYKRVYEKDLIAITVNAINGMIEKNEDCLSLLQDVLVDILRNDNTRDRQIKDRRAELNRLKKQSASILEQCMSNLVSGALLQGLNAKYNDFNERIEVLTSEIVSLEETSVDEESVQNKIEEVSKAIGRWHTVDKESLDRKTINIFVDKILIHKDGLMEMMLSTKNTVKVELQKNESRKKGRKASSTDTTYLYDEADYMKQLSRFVKGINAKHNQQLNSVTILRFSYNDLSES